MNTKEREEQKDRVMDMILTGYSQRSIAKKLNISTRTVVSYVKSRKAESIKELKQSVDEQIAEFEIAKNKRVQKLWTIALDTAEKSCDRNRAIQLLQKEEELSVKRRQIIGLLPADAPVVAIQNTNILEGVTTIADSIRRVYPGLVSKFGRNKIKSIDKENSGDKDESDSKARKL